MNKKNIIIIVIFTIIICAGIIYFIYLNSKETNTIIDEPYTNEIGYDYKITDNKIIFTLFDTQENGNILTTFYWKDLNDTQNPASQIKEKKFINVSDVSYSSDGSKVFFKHQNNKGEAINTVFDLKINEEYDLNKDIDKLIFTKDSQKIIYIYNGSEKTTLNIANIDGTNYEVLADVEKNDPGYDIYILNDDEIAYTKKLSPDQIDITNNINTLNLKEKTKNIIYDRYPVSNIVFSPDHKKFVGDFKLETFIAGAYNTINHSSSIFFIDYDQTDVTSAVWIDDNNTLIAISDYSQNQTYFLLLDLESNEVKKYIISDNINHSILDMQIVEENIYYSINNQLYRYSISKLLQDKNWVVIQKDVMKIPPDLE